VVSRDSFNTRLQEGLGRGRRKEKFERNQGILSIPKESGVYPRGRFNPNIALSVGGIKEIKREKIRLKKSIRRGYVGI